MKTDFNDLSFETINREVFLLEDLLEIRKFLGRRNNYCFGITLDYISGIKILDAQCVQSTYHHKMISTLITHYYGVELNVKTVDTRQFGFIRNTFGILYEDIKNITIELDVDEFDNSFLGKALINGSITTGSESVFGALKSAGDKQTLHGAYVKISTKSNDIIILYSNSHNITEINYIKNNIVFINEECLSNLD